MDKVQTGGILIDLKLSLGQFYCDGMAEMLASTIGKVIGYYSGGTLYSACLGTQLIVSTEPSLAAKTYSLTYPLLNHFSTQPITLTLTLSTIT